VGNDISPKAKATQEWLMANFEEALGNEIADPERRKALAKRLVEIYQAIEKGEVAEEFKSLDLRAFADKLVEELLSSIRNPDGLPDSLREILKKDVIEYVELIFKLIKGEEVTYKAKKFKLTSGQVKELLEQFNRKGDGIITTLLNFFQGQ